MWNLEDIYKVYILFFFFFFFSIYRYYVADFNITGLFTSICNQKKKKKKK